MARKILGFIQLILVIWAVLVIHEYGHYSEMKKRGVDVAEFSIGIGPPVFQHYSGSTVFSLRVVPIMAYVMPSKAGGEAINKMPFWGRFIIYSAGVRNNIISGLAGVWLLQALSLPLSIFILELLVYPFRILLLFFSFALSFFSRKGAELVERFRFFVFGDKYYNLHFNRFIWWSFALGFLNIMPLSGLDGQRIFIEILSMFVGTRIIFWVMWASLFLFFYMFIRGIRVGEFINYEDLE